MKNVILLALAVSVLSGCLTVDLSKMVADQFANSNAAPADEPKNKNAKPPRERAERAGDPSTRESDEYDSPMAKLVVKENLSKYQTIAGSTKSYPAGAALSRDTFSSIKPGEWASYRVFENQKLQSVIKMALVERKGTTWTYEWVNVSDEGLTAMQMTVENFEAVVKTGSSETSKVISLKVLDKNGRVKVMSPAVLGMMGDVYKNILTTATVDTNASFSAGGPVTVAAGTFAQTWRVESKVAKKNGSEKGVAYVSSIVPVWHLVKSSSDNGKYSMELLDFGSSGYVSMF